jgi:hypothetical protein
MDCCLPGSGPVSFGHCLFGDWRLEQDEVFYLTTLFFLLTLHSVTLRDRKTSLEQGWNDTNAVKDSVSSVIPKEGPSEVDGPLRIQGSLPACVCTFLSRASEVQEVAQNECLHPPSTQQTI